jgi:hypothetical protein
MLKNLTGGKIDNKNKISQKIIEHGKVVHKKNQSFFIRIIERRINTG